MSLSSLRPLGIGGWLPFSGAVIGLWLGLLGLCPGSSGKAPRGFDTWDGQAASKATHSDDWYPIAAGDERGDELTPGLTPEQIAAGWLSLFDGKTLYGWKAESTVDWQVVDGEIRASGGLVGLLRTTSQFGDYRLRLEFRAEPETNSGIFLRTSPQPRDPAADCYELNIAPPNNPFPTGSFVGREKAKVEFGALVADAWHQLEVLAEGGRFLVTIDGQEMLAYNDPKPLGRGYIGLQFNQGAVAFRKIALLPLGLKPLFNGRDLDGWDTRLAEASRSSVTSAGELQIQGGRGQLESKGRFGDFVLQLDCRTSAANQNSGIFFRAIPGQLMNGYESQIQNGMQEDNPEKPADFGTGGIFRRQPARRIVAQDQIWFTKTLIASGSHFATWVNGFQVCDWTDSRPAHENPRNGLRLDSGTLILQGHDPGTDILFRNLRAAELPPRRTEQ
ncbi:MAG: DUF1080 domain-containing protein [Planctomycetota bacterium]|jgi:hypothetical protein|nr:DUF1080 domain-containing protein [Blastopirellula sp.]